MLSAAFCIHHANSASGAMLLMYVLYGLHHTTFMAEASHSIRQTFTALQCIPIGPFGVYRNLTCLIKETSAVMPTDVLGSAGAGRVALKGLIPISPEGPGFILGGPVAGEAVGGLLVRVEMGFCILYISPPIMVCKTSQSCYFARDLIIVLFIDVNTNLKICNIV